MFYNCLEYLEKKSVKTCQILNNFILKFTNIILQYCIFFIYILDLKKMSSISEHQDLLKLVNAQNEGTSIIMKLLLIVLLSNYRPMEQSVGQAAGLCGKSIP